MACYRVNFTFTFTFIRKDAGMVAAVDKMMTGEGMLCYIRLDDVQLL